MNRVCVFCGSNRGSRADYSHAAQNLARELTRRGIGLVYGGGNVGLMGVLADTAVEAGGAVIGVIPEALVEWEVAHRGLGELRVVASMHERKALMAELSDAFIALPGGFGTFEEICEVITWGQLGLHTKPCGLLNVAGYFDQLIAQFDRGVAEKFIRPQHRDTVVIETDPGILVDRLAQYDAPALGKWMEMSDS